MFTMHWNKKKLYIKLYLKSFLDKGCLQLKSMNTLMNLLFWLYIWLTMNKHLLLSCIKKLIFVLKSLSEHNIDFLYWKKGSKVSFCFRLKRHILMVSTLALFSKLLDLLFLSAVKKVNFPQSRNFSTSKKMFLDQGNFPETRKFSTNKSFSLSKEVFFSQENLPQIKIFCKQISKRFSKSQTFRSI